MKTSRRFWRFILGPHKNDPHNDVFRLLVQRVLHEPDAVERQMIYGSYNHGHTKFVADSNFELPPLYDGDAVSIYCPPGVRCLSSDLGHSRVVDFTVAELNKARADLEENARTDKHQKNLNRLVWWGAFKKQSNTSVLRGLVEQWLGSDESSYRSSERRHYYLASKAFSAAEICPDIHDEVTVFVPSNIEMTGEPSYRDLHIARLKTDLRATLAEVRAAADKKRKSEQADKQARATIDARFVKLERQGKLLRLNALQKEQALDAYMQGPKRGNPDTRSQMDMHRLMDDPVFIAQESLELPPTISHYLYGLIIVPPGIEVSAPDGLGRNDIVYADDRENFLRDQNQEATKHFAQVLLECVYKRSYDSLVEIA